VDAHIGARTLGKFILQRLPPFAPFVWPGGR
jgi:hypothetical protein